MSLLSKQGRAGARGQETEIAFLEAAGALLAEGSAFADLNVNRLAARAGRTRTAFYAHFEDRRDLLMRLAEPVSAELFEVADRFLSVAPPIERRALDGTVKDLLGVFRRYEPVIRAVVEAAGYDTAVSGYWRALVERFGTAAQRQLESLGVTDSVQAQAIGNGLVWMTERVLYDQATHKEPDTDAAAVSGLSEIWWRTLTPGTGRS